WSASARPRLGRDSIWIACSHRSGRKLRVDEPSNPSTRTRATAEVLRRLVELCRRGLRILVGFDFPYGYPRGFARAIRCGGETPPWRTVWGEISRRIRDDESNRNNRFEMASDVNRRIGGPPGPFWGCPPRRATPTLRSTKGPFPHPTPGGLALAERRA